MATIEKRQQRGGVAYRAKVRMKCPLSGNVIRKTHQAPTKSEAKAWGQKIETDIRRGVYSAGGPVVKTVRALFSAYSAAELTGEKKWHRQYERYLEFWTDHLGPETPVRAVKADAITAGIAKLRNGGGFTGKPIAESSARTYYAPLSRAFHLAKEWEWIDRNPVKVVRRPKKARETNVFLTAKEKDSLLAACRQQDETGRLHDIVLLGMGTGIRQRALLGLTWRNVDLDREVITVTGKGGKTRQLPIVGSCIPMLRKRAEGASLDGFIFGGSNLDYKQWDRTRMTAGLPDLKFHGLRHTYATQLIRRGVPLKVVSKLLGHSDIRVTSRYIDVEDISYLTDSVKRLEGFV